MTTANKKSQKPAAPKADPKPGDAPKAKLPRTKKFGVLVSKLAGRVVALSLKLAKFGDATQPIRTSLVSASTALDDAKEKLNALPDNAFAKAPRGTKVALKVGDKVVLTDKARASFADLLTADEVKATFEVVTVAGNQLRVKTPGGATLFVKRAKLAPAPAPVVEIKAAAK